jgi:hypothetical protein
MNDYPADTPTLTPDTDTLEHHQLWLDAVQTAAARATEKLPTLTDAIAKAYTLVVEGKVEHLNGSTYQVASGLTRGKKYWQVDPFCNCPDGTTAPQRFCSHRLAVLLLLRAQDLLKGHTSQSTQVATEVKTREETAIPEPGSTHDNIPAHYLVTIQGTPAIKYAGLLILAHERGLVSLRAQWLMNDNDLSLAHAVATFEDGRSYEECGDASPANVNAKVVKHFRRVALTRAKARALRDALGIDLVALEELG